MFHPDRSDGFAGLPRNCQNKANRVQSCSQNARRRIIDMSLFRRLDNSPITFSCVGISEEDKKNLRKIVEENGGEIGMGEIQIVFTDKSTYLKDENDNCTRVYSIDFIKACAQQKQIVNIRRYRLSEKKLGESALLALFLYGINCLTCYQRELENSRHAANSASSSISNMETLNRVDCKHIHLNTGLEQMRSIQESRSAPGSIKIPVSPPTLSSDDTFYTPNNGGITIERMDSDESICEIPPSPIKHQFLPSQNRVKIKSSPDSSRRQSAENCERQIPVITLSPGSTISDCSDRVSSPRKTVLNPIHLVQNLSIDPPPFSAANHSSYESSEDNQTPLPKSESALEQESGPWIAPSDNWMHDRGNKSTHPTAAYIECNNGNARLLRQNVIPEFVGITEDSSPSDPCCIHDDSSTFDESEIDPLDGGPETRTTGLNDISVGDSATTTREKVSPIQTPRVPSVDEPQPGPSGLSRQYNNFISSDSDDDQEEVPIPTCQTNSARSSSDEEPATSNNGKRSKKTVDPPKKKKVHHQPAVDAYFEHVERPSQSSDGAVKTRRKQSKNSAALQYARDWRKKLAANRPGEQSVTGMKITRAEQKIMVEFLCQQPNIIEARPRGLTIWSKLLNAGKLPKRTPQSLLNHFVKILLPRIEDFFLGMSEDHKNQFLELQQLYSCKHHSKKDVNMK